MKQEKIVVILNAPPYSGKDTIADMIVEVLGANKMQFKQALYEKTAEYYDYDLEELISTAVDRDLKDNLKSEFSKVHGITPRSALIHVSEDVYKPRMGKDYFGVLAAKELVAGLNVFSDGGGWLPELGPVVEAADKVIICRLYRHGFTFDGDSRQYYPNKVDGATVADIHLQDNKPQIAVDAIMEMVK